MVKKKSLLKGRDVRIWLRDDEFKTVQALKLKTDLPLTSCTKIFISEVYRDLPGSVGYIPNPVVFAERILEKRVKRR